VTSDQKQLTETTNLRPIISPLNSKTIVLTEDMIPMTVPKRDKANLSIRQSKRLVLLQAEDLVPVRTRMV
jgi:hypothetical protein